MVISSSSPTPEAVLAVSDPIRPQIGRAVLGTLIAAATFVVFTSLTKEVKALYLHTPWQNDPYDAVVSFTLCFVLLVAALCAVRVPLCRRDSPLPLERALGLLRGSRVLIGAVLVTFLSDWTSVALRANRAEWTATTVWELLFLVLATGIALRATVDLRRASSVAPIAAAAGGTFTSDWFSDVLIVAERQCRWLGPLEESGVGAVRLVDKHVMTAVRRHPLAASGLAATAFGFAVAAGQSVEDGVSPATSLFVIVGACGMFAFLVTAGTYLRLVDNADHLRGARRRGIDALVAGCASVPIALAFRGLLWQLVGSSDASAGPWQLTSLLLVAGSVVVVLVFVGESVVRTHSVHAIRQ